MLDMEYQGLEDKIEGICLEEKLHCEFKKNVFPIVVTITPRKRNQDVIPGFEVETERVNGKLQFVFGEELKLSIDDDFDISDDLLSKIKNSLKKWHYTYLQYFYQVVKEREAAK